MAFKTNIPDKYKPEFPFLDDSVAMEKLSYESFTKAVDKHIKKLFKKGGLASIIAFRDEYQKRLDFVRSELKHNSDNKDLQNCELCYSYCVKRGYYYIKNSELLKDDRLPKECLVKVKELTENHSAWGVVPTFKEAYKCEDCRYEIVDGNREEIGSWKTLLRRVKKYYPALYNKATVQK